MNQWLFDFLDEVLQRYFGSWVGSCPRINRTDVDTLLTDDTYRRLAETRVAAVGWGETETTGDVVISAERLMITPFGLLYAAELKGSGRREASRPGPRLVDEPGPQPLPAGERRRLYYLATPPELFEPIVDQVGVAPLPQASAAAVDNRFGHELTFRWPLDTALRRMLDAHQVLRLALTGDDRHTGRR
jgi:Glucose-6-phosphate dehydrogenase, NAD binding domain